MKFNGIRKFWKNAVAFLEKYYRLVIAAAALSFLIRSEIREQLPTDTKSVRLRIAVQHQPGEIPLGTTTPEYVTALLSGNHSLLKNLSDNELEIKLDTVRAKREGDRKCVWNLKRDDVHVSRRIKVEKIFPDKVQLALDTIISKPLPVKPILNDSELPKGYKVGKVTVDPEKVQVSAPSTKFEVIREIRTLPISLKNITHSFDCDQGFDASADFDFDRKNVLVQVEILRAIKTKTVKTLPVRILIPPSSRLQTMSCEIVSAPTVDLEVSGEENVIDGLRKDDIFVFANISEFTKPGLYWIDLRCAIGKNGVNSFKINPQKVNVKLEQINRR